MAKKLKKLLNYWFNPENYSIIKSINGIIDTVNELIDGGGGGGSVETLNWTKVDTTVAIPALTDLGVNKLWQLSSNSFNIQGNHKGLMLESNYFELSALPLAPDNQLNLFVNLSNNTSYHIGVLKPKDGDLLGAGFNRLRLYVVKNPITGLYQMGFSATTENQNTYNGQTIISEVLPTALVQEISIPSVPLNLAADISEIRITGMIKNEKGAFATQGGVTFSLYVAD